MDPNYTLNPIHHARTGKIPYLKSMAAFKGTRRVGEMIKCYYNTKATDRCTRLKQNYGGSWYHVFKAFFGKEMAALAIKTDVPH